MPGVSDITALDFASPKDRDGKTQLEEARCGADFCGDEASGIARAASHSQIKFDLKSQRAA